MADGIVWDMTVDHFEERRRTNSEGEVESYSVVLEAYDSEGNVTERARITQGLPFDNIGIGEKVQLVVENPQTRLPVEEPEKTPG